MKKNAVLSLNLAVLLFGLAGLFAKWIHLPALGIAFGRVFFSSAALGLFLLSRRQSFHIAEKKDLLRLFCAGAILALHWWAFLESVQLSSVAIGTITFSAFPLFVTLLEPIVFHRELKAKAILLGLVIMIGVAVTVPELSFENRMVQGIAVGLVSALAYAVLTVMNKCLSASYSGTIISFYEQLTAALVLLPLVVRAGLRPTAADIGLLALLGVVTTAFAHTLFIYSLRDLPARLAGVCSSMETVYGIFFALILLGEIPSLREVIGAGIIVGAVLFAQITERESGMS